jgi:hypothetical protein
VDRPPQREGRVVRGSIWMSALGGEVLYEEDLPACCQRSARGQERSFECPALRRHVADGAARAARGGRLLAARP